MQLKKKIITLQQPGFKKLFRRFLICLSCLSVKKVPLEFSNNKKILREKYIQNKSERRINA